LGLKNEIYNFNWEFDLGFLFLGQDEQISLLSAYSQITDITKELHYNRNQLNINLPNSIEEAKKEGWYTVIAEYHQYWVPEWKENIKYVSPDGHREVIFSYLDWSIDNSIENMGTYNFFAPNFDFEGWDHLKYDVDPWKLWWNWLDDKQITN